MVPFIAVVAVLVFAATPAIAREFARYKVRKDISIEVGTPTPTAADAGTTAAAAVSPDASAAAPQRAARSR